MVPRKSLHVNTTLFFYIALFVLFVSSANASLHAPSNHRRLLKKRMPQLFGFPASPAAQNTGKDTSASVASASASTTATPTIATPTTVGQASTTLLSSISGQSTNPTASASSSGTSSSSSSTSSTSTSSLSSTSSASTFSSTGRPANSISSISVPSNTFTQTDTVSSVSPSASVQAQKDVASDSHKRTTITVIIIIAAGLAGIAIIWTLFRKWKLGRSSRFNERLEPIDWQPPSEDGHRRPISNASSFHSGDHGFGSVDHVQNSTLAPLPDHDFTALPSSRLAVVGGYADLARGPSPQPPQMQEAYGRHSPIMSRPNYDVNVPLHHQTGYGGRDTYEYTLSY